ncbi:YsnF/AvaK domain-containing protein [Bacillus sp. V5-8f]|uniref:YsnF/AvaK domain-containing protein n=1 Tax=Bacillus sp. V5-8f TaxID=2053044 RepID=UPI000C77CF8D|nr:YsnF/AvaK domain-containing protein [Bacillus sp. V5-8f]PLT32770.1 hypothetical protein CUU64_16600 [Bacillus sp. V5-8f]
MDKAIYGVYETSSDAIQAIHQLKAEGYEENNITLIADSEERLDLGTYTTMDVNTVTAESDDHTFMDKVAHFFSGDDYDRLEDKLAASGLTEGETEEYLGDIEQGRILLMLNTNATTNWADGRDTSVLGADVLAEDEAYRGSGEFRSRNQLNAGIQGKEDNNNERTLQLREEQLEVEKERVQAGEVVVNKEVTQEKRTLNVPVEHEEVYVERRKVDGAEQLDTGSIGKDETIRIPVTEEKLNVQKKPVVTDEIVIGKETVTETQQVSDSVKKEDVHFNKRGNALIHDEETR